MQSHRSLCGKQCQQIDGLFIEKIQVIALAVEHAHYFISHHHRNCQLRPRGFSGGDVTRIFGYVRNVERPLLFRRDARDAVADRQAEFVVSVVPADLAAHAEFLGFLIQQEDCDVLQMEVIPRNHQDPLQDFVQVEGGEHRLAGVVKDRDLLHVACRILPRGDNGTEVPKVTCPMAFRSSIPIQESPDPNYSMCSIGLLTIDS